MHWLVGLTASNYHVSELCRTSTWSQSCQPLSSGVEACQRPVCPCPDSSVVERWVHSSPSSCLLALETYQAWTGRTETNVGHMMRNRSDSLWLFSGLTCTWLWACQGHSLVKLYWRVSGGVGPGPGSQDCNGWASWLDPKRTRMAPRSGMWQKLRRRPAEGLDSGRSPGLWYATWQEPQNQVS